MWIIRSARTKRLPDLKQLFDYFRSRAPDYPAFIFVRITDINLAVEYVPVFFYFGFVKQHGDRHSKHFTYGYGMKATNGDILKPDVVVGVSSSSPTISTSRVLSPNSSQLSRRAVSSSVASSWLRAPPGNDICPL
jgi:hypothetical protein